MRFDAVVMDVDGVLTRTATVHERAWKELFDAVLVGCGDPRPFSRLDYLTYVDGKPRLDGLRDFLASRGVRLPPREVLRLAGRKDRTFVRIVEREGVEAFEDAVDQVRRWRRRGLRIAFVSASRNAGRVLRAAGLEGLCDVRVDGETAAEVGLTGKVELFREAARRLGTEPARAVAVEDAVAGVEAAREVGFGLVVGVARTGDAAALVARGADRVVGGLDELDEVVD